MVDTPTITPTGKPCWSRDAAIGDYGGSLDKIASRTEGDAPYAWFVYRELSAMRGSAYAGYSALNTNTLVHCEHLALARMLAWANFRLPEQFRANCLPGTADQGLEYWAKVLAVPTKSSDQRWQVRQRCAAHYKAVTDASLSAIQTALSELLGDVYVDATFIEGGLLTTPPTQTYWPSINPGDPALDLGGGTWTSERSHLWVEVQQPAGMSDGEFIQLTQVQAFQLLDRMLPAYCSFTVSVGDGFDLDVDRLDYTGLTTS
jgi:hypothetical protein